MVLIEKLHGTADVIRFSAAISACQALRLYHRMRETGIIADAISSSMAISTYVKHMQSSMDCSRGRHLHRFARCATLAELRDRPDCQCD